MKNIYILFILIMPLTAGADNILSYTLTTGFSVIRPGADEVNAQNQMVAAGVRYYENNNMFYSANLTSWNSGTNNEFSKKGTILTANIGYRTTGTLFFETSIGVGYLNNPDGKKVEIDDETIEQGYTTGHRQFEMNFGGGYKFDKNFDIVLGWTHFSNCKTICKLDSSYEPNGGRDFVRFNIEKRF